MSVRSRGMIFSPETKTSKKVHVMRVAVMLVVFAGYYLSSKQPDGWDHTYRIAKVMIDGELGLPQAPGNELVEMIPLNGRYYSVFPFGSVAAMLPLAILERAGFLDSYPALKIHAAIAAFIALFLMLIASRYPLPLGLQLTYVMYPLFGTWLWCCMIYLGPWQLNLGVSVLGQLGALYFSLVRFIPWLAGFFFALAFGHRTEAIVLAPVFFWLISREALARRFSRRQILSALIWFSAIPFLLGVSTLWYNFARFGSIADFGYGRIPGVLEDDVYRHGIMAWSLEYIQRNSYIMLLRGWRCVSTFPYILPEPFGGSIFLYSPFLVLLFRFRSSCREIKIVSVVSILLLTLSLWTHGEPGGWQFSYRYASVLIPWFFLILLDSSSNRLSVMSWCLFILSIAMNAYGTYLYHWVEAEYLLSPGGPENRCPFWLLRDSWVFH